MKNRWLPVCRGCFARLIATPRSWVVLIVTGLYLQKTLAPVRAMLAAEGLTVNPMGLMAFLLNDTVVTAFLALACLALMFDAPCTDELQRYLILRTGRRSWALGQAAYMLLTVMVYLLLVTVLAWLMLLPYIELSADWGSGMRALVEDFQWEVYGSDLNYDVWIPRAYAPIPAWLIGGALHVLSLSLLCMLMMLANLLLDRRLSFVLVALPIGFDLMLEEYFGVEAYYLSPLSLSKLSGLDYGDRMGRPPVWFGALALSLLLGLCIAAFVRGARRRELKM